MNNKKIIIPVLAFLVLIPIALADSVLQNIVPSILTDLIQGLFGAESVGFAYQRFLIWLGLFTMFLALLQMTAFGDAKTKKGWISITLAIVISGIITLGLPNTVVETIFGLYGGIASLILLLAPSIFVVWFIYKIKADSFGVHFMRFLFLVIVGTILLSNIIPDATDFTLIPGVEGGDWATVSSFISFAGAILYLLSLFELGKMVGKFGMGDTPGFSGRSSGGVWNYLRRETPRQARRFFDWRSNVNDRRYRNRRNAYEELRRVYMEDTKDLDKIISQADELKRYPVESMYEQGVRKRSVATELGYSMKNHLKNIAKFIRHVSEEYELGNNDDIVLKANDIYRRFKDYLEKNFTTSGFGSWFKRRPVVKEAFSNRENNIETYRELTRRHYNDLLDLQRMHAELESVINERDPPVDPTSPRNPPTDPVDPTSPRNPPTDPVDPTSPRNPPTDPVDPTSPRNPPTDPAVGGVPATNSATSQQEEAEEAEVIEEIVEGTKETIKQIAAAGKATEQIKEESKKIEESLVLVQKGLAKETEIQVQSTMSDEFRDYMIDAVASEKEVLQKELKVIGDVVERLLSTISISEELIGSNPELIRKIQTGIQLGYQNSTRNKREYILRIANEVRNTEENLGKEIAVAKEKLNTFSIDKEMMNVLNKILNVVEDYYRQLTDENKEALGIELEKALKGLIDTHKSNLNNVKKLVEELFNHNKTMSEYNEKINKNLKILLQVQKLYLAKFGKKK